MGVKPQENTHTVFEALPHIRTWSDVKLGAFRNNLKLKPLKPVLLPTTVSYHFKRVLVVNFVKTQANNFPNDEAVQKEPLQYQ